MGHRWQVTYIPIAPEAANGAEDHSRSESLSSFQAEADRYCFSSEASISRLRASNPLLTLPFLISE